EEGGADRQEPFEWMHAISLSNTRSIGPVALVDRFEFANRSVRSPRSRPTVPVTALRVSMVAHATGDRSQGRDVKPRHRVAPWVAQQIDQQRSYVSVRPLMVLPTTLPSITSFRAERQRCRGTIEWWHAIGTSCPRGRTAQA